MWSNGITPDDVQGRSRVSKLASTNLAEAIAVAKAIKHPWYRCQALSIAAEHATSKNQKLELLQKAFDSAQLQTEINRAVTVSAWPLRVLAPLAPNEAKERIMALVNQANREPHTLRRADALFALANAVHSDTSLLAIIAPALTTALVNGHGWRIDRLIRFSAPHVKDLMPDMFQKLVAHHSENGQKRKWLASLQA